MDTALAVKGFRYQSWAEMVREQSESGLTIREWCKQNDISTKSFYYRRKRLREEFLQDAAPSFARLMPVKAEGGDCPPSSFLPQLTISIDGATIGVSAQTPRNLLLDVIGVIRNA